MTAGFEMARITEQYAKELNEQLTNALFKIAKLENEIKEMKQNGTNK